MKTVRLIVAGLLVASAAYAADFASQSTDELLELRGTMTSEQERNALHNELELREKTMTKEQMDKFNTYPPENRVRKFKHQEERIQLKEQNMNQIQNETGQGSMGSAKGGGR